MESDALPTSSQSGCGPDSIELPPTTSVDLTAYVDQMLAAARGRNALSGRSSHLPG